MKKTVAFLLTFCMTMSLAACGGEKPTESPAEEKQTAEVLSLQKSLQNKYEWEDDTLLVQSEHSYVTLRDGENYPEMAETLNQLSVMQKRSMEDEFDNFCSMAREEMKTYVSTLDVQVRRADSIVVSLLSDSYSDYGQIENYRVFHGSNYDTQTGRALMLNEVVNVNNDLALAVQEELTGHMWTGEFYSEDTVEDYFANTPYDSFHWTLDYTGVTFYFAPGELCDGGAMTATVSFAQYPELFNEKYMEVPESYTVELPLDISFFTNLDGDDALEGVSLSGWYDEERNHYLDCGIFTDTDAGYHYEECYVYDFHPYYVRAESGHYLYLFCEDFEEGWRQMNLIVFSLNGDGSVTKSSQINVSPSWLADNRFLVPTDPGCLLLDDPDHSTVKTEFSVGDDGMPYQCIPDR